MKQFNINLNILDGNLEAVMPSENKNLCKLLTPSRDAKNATNKICYCQTVFYFFSNTVKVKYYSTISRNVFIIF